MKREAKQISEDRFDSDLLARMCTKVIAEGFVPAEALKTEFGPEGFSRGIAVLYRTYRLFREVRRSWKDGQDVLGYEWADPRWSQKQITKLPSEMGFVIPFLQSHAPRYKDFQHVRVRCRWINQILGAVPVKTEAEDELLVFERDTTGNILILRYNQRAMAARALPVMGKEATLAGHILWSMIRIPFSVIVKIVQHGIVESVGTPGGKGRGKGLRQQESIPDGTEFIIDARVPLSAITVAEFLEMLRLAGQYVGLSPARSAGFGDFEVLEVLGTE